MSAKRVARHALADRLTHWLFAIATLVLLITGFLPIVGVKFEWVTIHWSAGVAVLVFVIWHLIRRLGFTALKRMWLGLVDIKLAVEGLKQSGVKTGKYSLAQKLMHHGVAVLLLVTLVSGLLMMVRIDTPFWERNIYLFGDTTWGFIYAAHGLAAMMLLTTVMLHVYFALRPEKLMYTRSMLRGWLTQDEYDAHHSNELWPIETVEKSND